MKNLDWANLTFSYTKTDYNVRCNYRNGKWGEIEITSDEYLNMHMAASCLHYSQEGFEGLKAYRGKDGKVRLFRPEDFIVVADYREIYQNPSDKCNLYLQSAPHGVSRATLETKQVDYLIEDD